MKCPDRRVFKEKVLITKASDKVGPMLVPTKPYGTSSCLSLFIQGLKYDAAHNEYNSASAYDCKRLEIGWYLSWRESVAEVRAKDEWLKVFSHTLRGFILERLGLSLLDVSVHHGGM
jgi:hypothetical protein